MVVKGQIVSTWNRTLVHLVAFPSNNCHDAHKVNINKGRYRFRLVKAHIAMGHGYKMEVSKF